jgi:hypothetical protein
MKKLENQLSRVKTAGDLLKKVPMLKTKQAAQMLGDETLILLGLFVEKLNEQADEITLLKERL